MLVLMLWVLVVMVVVGCNVVGDVMVVAGCHVVGDAVGCHVFIVGGYGCCWLSYCMSCCRCYGC